MFATPTIREIPTDLPHLHAFRIVAEVTRDDMTAMSEHMLEVFDAAPTKVDMLLQFDTNATAEAGAGLSLDSLKARVASLAKVRNYVVSNAPGAAGGLVEAMGKVIPVEARAFETEDAALTWLKAQPAP
ncbi:STAS/SEC14 domain-containing protein [uncultured Jannaschia sp.]|uniref:STAS/SEC14 domain-containing protein n=1 Tax=uncultured Jannaschia sp. TaxID=293347 RepID=UPI0026288225|nr:STAS/SEC14 domain-containing protein [uncultured Jannaschia sp.]